MQCTNGPYAISYIKNNTKLSLNWLHFNFRQNEKKKGPKIFKFRQKELHLIFRLNIPSTFFNKAAFILCSTNKNTPESPNFSLVYEKSDCSITLAYTHIPVHRKIAVFL